MSELQGNVVTIIQVIALIMLVVGVYPYRIRTKNRNLIMHGFLSIIALALNLGTIFYAMVPGFSSVFEPLSELSTVQLSIVWVHTGIGISAVVLAFVIIASWIIHPLGELNCSKNWKLMLPTFILWTVSLVLGVVIHFFGII
jgi:uncharacterized membrane protein YozB (DUF420 family)